MTKEIQKSIADLQKELNNLAPAVKHIEQASIVAGNVATISNSFIESSKKIEQLIIKDFGVSVLDKSVNHLDSLNEHILNIDKQIKKLEGLDFKLLFESIQKSFLLQFKKELNLELDKLNQVIFWFKDEINAEIERLKSVNFENKFDELQKKFLVQAQKNLKSELDKFDIKLVEFDLQIKRIESIDLEKEFSKLQKTLSDIFGAVNGINSTFTNVVQSQNSISQNIGSIQVNFEKKLNNTQNLITANIDTIDKHLSLQDKLYKSNIESLKKEIQTLYDLNTELNNGIKANKSISIMGFIILLIAIVYSIMK